MQTTKQLQAAALLARGHSVAETARAVGVGRATLFRWLQQDSFRKLIEQETVKVMEQFEIELQKLTSHAIFALSQSLDRLERLVRWVHEKVQRSQGDEAVKWALCAARIDQAIATIALKQLSGIEKRKGMDASDFGDWVAALQLGELDSFEGDENEQT